MPVHVFQYSTWLSQYGCPCEYFRDSHITDLISLEKVGHVHTKVQKNFNSLKEFSFITVKLMFHNSEYFAPSLDIETDICKVKTTLQ